MGGRPTDVTLQSLEDQPTTGAQYQLIWEGAAASLILNSGWNIANIQPVVCFYTTVFS